MARPQVADGGDGLQMWRVAANILNKQSQRTADRGWPSRLSVGRGAKKNSNLLRNITESLGLERTPARPKRREYV
jgi:hypothetical protein